MERGRRGNRKWKLDINTADLTQLQSLTGVGPRKAKQIIKSRKIRGGFVSVKDLSDIPGIGENIVNLNRHRLICSKLAQIAAARRAKACRRETRSSARTKQWLALERTGKEMDHGSPGKEKPSTSHPNQHLKEVADEEDDVPPECTDTPSPSACTTPLLETTSAVTLLHLKNTMATTCASDNGDSDTDDDDGDDNDNSIGEREQSDISDIEADEIAAAKQNTIVDEHTEKIRQRKLSKRKSERDEPTTENCAAKIKRKSGDSPTGTPNSSSTRKMCQFSDSLPPFYSQSASYHYPPQEGVMADRHQAFGLPTGATSASLTPRRRIPSKSNPPVEMNEWLKVFQSWSNAERLLALDQLIELCEPTQVRHIMTVIEPQFQRDFISLLPKELALYVLSFLEPRSLLHAAQTCRYWRVLAEDNLLWREKCREAGIDEAVVFNKKRRLVSGTHRSPWKSAYMRQHQIEMNWRVGQIRTPKVLKGHDDHVITCLQFSGNRVVSGSDDNTLKVWSATTGKCLRTLVGHTGGVWSSQMSGNIIISGSTDRTLKVWNADTGQCTHTLYGHTSTVRCMHLHGNKVVSGSRDATLRVWDVDSGECLHVLMGHVAAVRCVQYDGKRVVSGAYDYTVKVWNPDSEECLHTLTGHTNRVYSLQFDGIHVVSGSLDTSIRVWDIETGNCLHTLMGHQSLTSGMELKDNILVSGNADSTVKVWDIVTGQCLQTLTGPNKHQSAVTCLQFNSKFVITSSDDGTVKLWDLKTGEFLRNLVSLDSGGSGGVVWRIRASQTKLVCAVGSRNGTEETKLLVQDFDADVK